jgi:hypothetical protein
MVIICLPNGTEWFNSNWVFRQLHADVVERFPDDAELHLEMEKAGAFGLLSLDSIEPVLASRILRAMRTVAEETVRGQIAGWLRGKPDDQEGQRTYLESMTELLELMRRQPDGVSSETAPEGDSGRQQPGRSAPGP